MAFQVQKINPLDRQPRKAVGVSLPFSGKAVFNSTYQTKDGVKTNLLNFFLTGRGERYFNPSFGAGLRNLFFDNITQARIEQIKDVVTDNLQLYFPRVIVRDLNINATPDTNTVTLALRYAISETNATSEEIIIAFEQ
jgi:phage baseplate assembly protein W